jgi:hypothetical protein
MADEESTITGQPDEPASDEMRLVRATELTEDAADRVEGELVVLQRSGAEQINAERVKLEQSGARAIGARSIRMDQSGALTMKGERVVLENGTGRPGFGWKRSHGPQPGDSDPRPEGPDGGLARAHPHRQGRR